MATRRLATKGDAATPDETARFESYAAEAAALAAGIDDFVADAIGDGDSASPLLEALQGERLTGGVSHVAIVPPARIDLHQVEQHRRLFSSRVLVTATATIDLAVLDVGERTIVASEPVRGSSAFEVVLPVWWWPWAKATRREPRLQELQLVGNDELAAAAGAAATGADRPRR